MTGPDLTNSLLGILLRFRKEAIAVTADVEQMFYCFKVDKKHRDYLRFLWCKINDFTQPLIEYRMTVHVFGNAPSPAIAKYGLRKAVEKADLEVQHFIENDFYVDDGLMSVSSETEAVDLIKKTQSALKDGGNIRLHKFASNSQNVLSCLDSEDLAKEIKDLNFDTEILPFQRSLGLTWNLANDCFTFQVCSENRQFTRRGVLSTVNSLYDPVGFVAPMVIQGKLLLRKFMTENTDWDEPLPSTQHKKWQNWCDSLQSLTNIEIPRAYSKLSFKNSSSKEVHIFSDASNEAIAAIAYLKLYDVNRVCDSSFLLGKAKVAPQSGHTIPRLELCAAVLSVEIADCLQQELDIEPKCFKFYTDSKVVLGYIHNERRRFHVYVSNRIDRIRRSSEPKQWDYVETDINPADKATRLQSSSSYCANCVWLTGPDFIRQDNSSSNHDSQIFPLVKPETDKELKTTLTSAKTCVKPHTHQSLGAERFTRFSSWKKLVRTISHLKHVCRSFGTVASTCVGWHQCKEFKSATDLQDAETLIIKVVQQEAFLDEITCLQRQEPLPRTRTLLKLTPTLDQKGILRVGGRLKNSSLTIDEVNPIIIPKRSHLATLLIRHFHDKVSHQGRHLTEGAIRSSGFWIVGAKRHVSSLISKCVTCRRLRCKPQTQMMADLPADRVTPCPPFTYVGVDVFGPWEITTKKLRGGSLNSKRWAVLFTCLVIRAVHIDLVETMTTSSFINCLRRFIAVRGEVKQFRSDCGTNFIGATQPLNIDTVNVKEGPVADFLSESRVTWIFNTPHSSHMGGVWERMVGTARRILDAMLLTTKTLTHEVLSTLMAEVMAIINARPITSISTDSEDPFILSPATLLTQKDNHTLSFDVPTDEKDMYTSQWKHVQILAEKFWTHWKTDYLQNLQKRSKWTAQQSNLQEGDVVLVRDKQCARNSWPLGVVQTVFPGQDGLVRKVAIRVYQDKGIRIYNRPITELVHLF